MSCLPRWFLRSEKAGTTPACILMISRLSLWYILLGWQARVMCEHERASLPALRRTPVRLPRGCSCPGCQDAFADARANPEDLRSPCPACSLRCQTFQVTVQVTGSPPRTGYPPAGGTGTWAYTPGCRGHYSAIRRGAGAWAICDFGPKHLCHVASLPQVTSPWGQAGSRVNWNYFWEGRWQKGCSSTAQVPCFLHRPRQDLVEQLK